jgi:AcrR family transcriptional regulator
MSNPKTPARKSTAAAAVKPKRPRGRPARLSRQAIIDQAMALLATRSADELTLTSVAAGLGTATMSLYNYFPNHEALLNAVADHAFSLLKLPKQKANEPWQETVLAWLWALQHHCQRYPVVFKMIGLEGQLSTAWLKVCAPIIQLLRDQGLEGDGLAFVSAWFANHTIGFMLAEASAPAFRHPISLSHLEKLSPEEQELFLSLRGHLPAVSTEKVLDFGFRLLIKGIEQLVPPSTKKRSRSTS